MFFTAFSDTIPNLAQKNVMKIIKKIVLVFVAVFTLASVVGYLYFDRKFTPPENYLKVSGMTKKMPFKWASDEENSYAAMLLPIRIKGIDKTFYMQLDSGSPSTVFYKKSLESIQKKFPKQLNFNESLNEISLVFNLKDMTVSSESFELLDYGNNVDFETPNTENIIGTIGTDLFEKRKVEIDFKNKRISLLEKIDDKGFSTFEFKKRKIIFPMIIDNQKMKLLYDSGTSGYELIVNKEKWILYKSKKGKIKKEKGNSWGTVLSVFTAPATKCIEFGNLQLQLSEITYIEGTSELQKMLMKRSGMQGMMGNKLLLNHKLILDCKNEKFKIED